LKLLTEAQKTETKVSKLLLQALEASSYIHWLRKQVDFLEGHTKKIVKGKLNGLEALYRVVVNLSEGFGSPPTIASSSPSY
jgi:hypothetical protein